MTGNSYTGTGLDRSIGRARERSRISARHIMSVDCCNAMRRCLAVGHTRETSTQARRFTWFIEGDSESCIFFMSIILDANTHIGSSWWSSNSKPRGNNEVISVMGVVCDVVLENCNTWGPRPLPRGSFDPIQPGQGVQGGVVRLDRPCDSRLTKLQDLRGVLSLHRCLSYELARPKSCP